VLLGLGALAGAAFLVGDGLDVYWLCLAAKPVPVLALAAYLLPAKSWLSRLVVAGLLLSVAGDVLLEIEADLFVPGLVAFLLAHLAYIAGFVADTRRLHLLRLLPFAGYGATAYVILLPGLGEMTVPVTAYMVVICAMMWRASARIGEARPLLAWLGLAGAVVFAVSDTLIAVDRFMVEVPAASTMIILLYWAGQLGITLSVDRFHHRQNCPSRIALPR
jgi:uncharacterized membrane protein YhhN